MRTPYHAEVSLPTVTDEQNKSPQTAAKIAHEVSPKQAITERAEYIKIIARKNQESIGAQKLLKVLEQRNDAHHVLSVVGYDLLRHLQADGVTIAEIAMDIGVNQLDIMAFMSTHPEAVEHAEIDSAACADMKMAEFMRYVETAIPETKFEAERMRTQLQALEMLTKRLSPKWAIQMKDAQIAGGTPVGVTFNIDLSGNIVPPVKRVEGAVVEVE